MPQRFTLEAILAFERPLVPDSVGSGELHPPAHPDSNSASSRRVHECARAPGDGSEVPFVGGPRPREVCQRVGLSAWASALEQLFEEAPHDLRVALCVGVCVYT